MVDKVETGASETKPKTAENGAETPATENNSTPKPDQPNDHGTANFTGDQINEIHSIVGEVLAEAPTLVASLVDMLERTIEEKSAAAFAAILADPATAAAARQAAIEVRDAADADEAVRVQSELREAAEAAKVQAAEDAKAEKQAREDAKVLHGKALKRLVRHNAEAVNDKHPIAGLLAEAKDATIVFSNGETFIVGHQVDVGADDFTVSGGQATYGKRIAFADGDAGLATSAWLLLHDDQSHLHVRRADLGAGLQIGGGAQAVIPAGHLAF